MNEVSKREKVFYIIMIIFYALAPFSLFFDVFVQRSSKKAIDGDGVVVTDYYNIINVKDVRIFPCIIGIVFIVISLILAILLVMDLYQGKFYKSDVKALSGLVFILLATIVWHFSLVLGIIFFMAVCNNLFMLSFDLKINRNKKENLAIYLPTYFLFLIALLFGVTILGLF